MATAGSLGPAAPNSRARITLLLEGLILALATGVQLTLRVLYLFNHKTDSDETQHLHVIWGWTQGLVQYRDLFDNHAPLFHLMLAPAVLLIGEHSDILVLARALLVPFVGLSLWATYRLGARLWSRSVGAWAALLSGLAPIWLLTSSEFRADVLWMALWLCSLLVLLGRTITPRRGFLGGLLLGATLATSLKSILLLVSLALAGLVVATLRRRDGERAGQGWNGRVVAWTAAGFLLLPALILFAFWRLGALAALSYCTVEHNALPGLGFWKSPSPRLLFLPAALLALVPAARHMLRQRAADSAARPRVVLFLTTALFLVLLEGYWPLITREDFLPWVPTMVLLAVATARTACMRLERGRQESIFPIGLVAALAVVAALEIIDVSRTEAAWRDDDSGQPRLLADVLSLTRDHEPIMDAKGETVFRSRPYYFVLEGITTARIARGLLPDRIALDVERTRTHFAVLDNDRFPPAGRRFLNTHFVPVGTLRVLGSDLGKSSVDGALERSFDVSYLERFAVLADGAPARGRLDGTPYRGARELAVGQHRYRPAKGESHVVVVWEGALERDSLRRAILASAR